jgi:hypothetical protein
MTVTATLAKTSDRLTTVLKTTSKMTITGVTFQQQQQKPQKN